jgi:hypothetical protein
MHTGQSEPDSPVAQDATDTDDAPSAADDPTEPTNTASTDSAADDAQGTADTEATDPAEAEPVAEPTEPTNDGAAAADMATDGSGDENAARLAPGALRGMVEDYLRDHPGEEFGPAAIAKALGGKSSGAVSNALDKLVEDDTAVKTNGKPRRFTVTAATAR